MDWLKLRDYQHENLNAIAVNFFARPEDAVWRQLTVLPTGCHAPGQLILMFDGSTKKIEDIKVGDELMGPDSTPRTVLRTLHGEDEMYEITPTKGAPFVVNQAHTLRLVSTGQGDEYPSERGGRYVEVTVKDYLNWSKTKKHVHKLYRVGVEFAETPTPLPPYLLGLFLGDGSIRTAAVHSTDADILTQLVQYADRMGLRIRPDFSGACPSYYFTAPTRGENNVLRDYLRKALDGEPKAGNKFIPHEYKCSSRLQRLQVLAGLMDTDGHCANGTGYDFVSKSPRLANDVAFVARSVGLAAYVSPCKKSSQNGTVGDYYRVSISGDCSIIPCELGHKQASVRKQKKDALRVGFTIGHVGRGPYYGVTVDKDNLYLLDDFTVTRNCGKTVVAGTVPHQPAIQQWLSGYPVNQRKIMFIAHTDELIKQAAKKIKFYNPDLNVQIEKAEQHADTDADVVVASVATLAASNGRRMGKFDMNDFRIVIIDEAHHAVAGSYQKVMQYFQFLPPDNFMPQPSGLDVDAALAWQRNRLQNWDAVAPRDRLLMGITATSRRGDKIGLELVFQKIVFQRNVLDMIKAGYLANMRALRINSNVNLDNVDVAGSDLNQVQLAEAVNKAERNRLIVKSWLEHAEGKKTIAFTVNIGQAETLAAEFKANGVAAEAVSGKTSDSEREKILSDFSKGLIKVVVNCQILTEGFDDPEVECIIMARPTKSQLLYVQMAGRGVRLHPCDPVGIARLKVKPDSLKKPYCLMLDIVDVTSRHRLIAAPTLVGLPANFDTQGADLVEMVDRIEQIKAKSPYLDVEGMTAEGAKTLDQIELQAQEVDLFEPFHDPEMEEHSDLAWMKTEPSHYEIGFQGPMTNENLIIQQNAIGQWEVMLKEFGPPRPVINKPFVSLDEAFDNAEMWLEINRSLRVNDLKRNAGWRKGAPNDRQIRKINSYKMNLDPKKMTRGEAASVISLMESRKRKVAGR